MPGGGVKSSAHGSSDAEAAVAARHRNPQRYECLITFMNLLFQFEGVLPDAGGIGRQLHAILAGFEVLPVVKCPKRRQSQ